MKNLQVFLYFINIYKTLDVEYFLQEKLVRINLQYEHHFTFTDI